MLTVGATGVHQHGQGQGVIARGVSLSEAVGGEPNVSVGIGLAAPQFGQATGEQEVVGALRGALIVEACGQATVWGPPFFEVSLHHRVQHRGRVFTRSRTVGHGDGLSRGREFGV